MGKPDTSSSQAIQTQQVDLAKGQDARSQQLFNLTEPGLATAENWYKTLSTGDPTKLFTAVAPAAEAVAGQKEAALKNIDLTAPRGGEERLAKDLTTAAAGGQVGRLITTAYTSSFPALATLAGQGIGLSINEAANAISALGGASNTAGNIMQAQASGKAATMGFLGSLAGAGGAIGAAAMPACWIAEVIYGPYDARTKMLRRWLNEVYDKDPVGKYVVALYRRFGRQVARWVARHSIARRLFKLLFDKALERAGRELSGKEARAWLLRRA